MTVSNYQINSVIRTYMKNMKSRISHTEMACEGPPEEGEDNVSISEEGMKRVFFERIGQKMTERLRRYDQEG